MPDLARRISYGEALQEGLDQLMSEDRRVVVIGEGVPDPKAIFNTTLGLKEKYGPKRVFDMPLSENGVTGVCIGAALTGLRPVMVHQRIDFSLLAMDQIVNNAAKWHFMFAGQGSVPLVIRMIIGRGWGQGPQHSQGLHSVFSLIPGLQVVVPATPRDAKGMLVAAVREDNPVVFIEHRWLHRVIDEVPSEIYASSLTGARVVRRGTSNTVTIAALSYAVLEALEAAKALSVCMGIDVEVVDLRCTRPLDHKTIVESVKQTGRLLIVDHSFASGSLSGELSYRVARECFPELKDAPERVCLPDYPVPTSPSLTADYYPGPLQIAVAVLRLMKVDLGAQGYTRLADALSTKGPHDVPSLDFSGPF